MVKGFVLALILTLISTSATFAQGGREAVLLGTFGNWGAYSADAGGTKVCYALSQPVERRPEALSRGAGYIFISFRPSMKITNEVAVVMGFPAQEGRARGLVDGRPFKRAIQAFRQYQARGDCFVARN